MRILRRRLKLTRGRITRMSQERQRLSFLLVVIFLALFGLIVLAEVLFVDNYEEHNWIDVDDFNDDDGSDLLRWISTSVGSGGANGGGGAEKKRQRFNLRQREMEMLISNISEGMKTALPAFRNKKLPPKPYNYAADEFLPEGAFDFSADGGGLGRGVDAQWQPVAGTMDKFYVYSAYLDARKGGRKGGGGGHNIVRIIGVARTKFPDKVACRLWWNGGRQKDGDGQGDQPPRPSLPRRVPATVTVIRENWNLRYSAVFVLCPLPDVAGHPLPPPAAVSVIAAGWSKASAATNQLPVLNADVDLADAERRLAASDAVGVCVKPFHFNYSRTVDLIEFIELNRILGVRGFTFYNDTLSEESGCVLRHYNRTASIELHPWRLNMGSQTEIRTEGLFAALNDCLYRNMYAFNYLLLIDLDEFVVPQTNLSSLAQMLRSVDAAKSATLARRGHKDTSAARVTASYSFQNSFFYLQFPDDPGNGDEDRLWTRLRTLTKTRRKSKFNPPKQRSKYVCVPRRVREAGNHFVWEFAEGFNVNVPPSVGFLHHYRVCEFGGDDCVNTESVVDRKIADSYGSELASNIRAVINELEPVCGLKHLLE